MRRRTAYDKDSVTGMVKAIASRLGVFHISEMKCAVLKQIPDATVMTIYSAVWNLTHKFNYLESPRRSLYRLRKEDGA